MGTGLWSADWKGSAKNRGVKERNFEEVCKRACPAYRGRVTQKTMQKSKCWPQLTRGEMPSKVGYRKEIAQGWT